MFRQAMLLEAVCLQCMLGRTIGRNMFRRLALGSPYSKPITATAEDGLQHPARVDASPGYTFVSIAALRIPTQRAMQCGYRSSIRLIVDSAVPYAQVEHAQAMESCARHSFGDNNGRSGQLAETITEAHVFRRNSADENDRLPEIRSPDSGILRETGSKRARKGCSQKYFLE